MIKIGLYSITYLGVWYRGAALTLEQVIARAREYGYAGIEIDGKRPHGNPIDLAPARCRDVRRIAEDAGIEIYAIAANNDFSSPIPEHRESQLAYVRDLVRMAADAGAPVLRVFAAWPGVTLANRSEDAGRYDIARRIWAATHEAFGVEQTWERCRGGLIEVARWAADHGVTLALQNHPPVIENVADMLRMIAEVGSPSLKDWLRRLPGVRAMPSAAAGGGRHGRHRLRGSKRPACRRIHAGASGERCRTRSDPALTDRRSESGMPNAKTWCFAVGI